MAATIRASQQGIEIVDKARKKKGWNQTEDAWWGLANTTKATLKRFWRRLAIERDTFIQICEAVGQKWEEIVDNSPLTKTNLRAEFFAYDDVWVGREQLVCELKEKIQGSCRLLILVGIAGIGKTAVAER